MNASIIDLIPKGKENAIKHDALVDMCIRYGLISSTNSKEMANRELRRLLNQARASASILNNSDGKGYYRPTKEDMADIKKFITQEERRAMNIFASLKITRKTYDDYLHERVME